MSYLNKIITTLLMVSFLFCGVANAIIEKDTTKKKTDNSQNVRPGDYNNKAGSAPNGRAGQKRPSGYDNFIDNNNNGIDDRAEQKNDNRKTENSSENSDLNRSNQNNESNKIRRSPDDSLVKLKNR